MSAKITNTGGAAKARQDEEKVETQIHDVLAYASTALAPQSTYTQTHPHVTHFTTRKHGNISHDARVHRALPPKRVCSSLRSG